MNAKTLLWLLAMSLLCSAAWLWLLWEIYQAVQVLLELVARTLETERVL